MQHIVSRGHTRPLTEINFIEDGQPTNTLLVSASHDKLPQVRNGENGDWIGTFQGHKGAVWSATIDSFSRTLALTGSGDFSARLWCATTGKMISEYKHKHVVRSVDFSQDAQQFITGSQDGIVRLYTTSNSAAEPFRIDNGQTDPVIKTCWASASTIVVGRRSGTLELYDTREFNSGSESGITKPVASNKLGSDPIMDIEVQSSAGRAICAYSKQTALVSLNDLTVEKSFDMPDTMHFREEGGVSMHPNGRTFMAGASDLWLREFDALTGEVLRTFKGHHGPIRCVRFHPDGHLVASGSEDATIRLWSTA